MRFDRRFRTFALLAPFALAATLGCSATGLHSVPSNQPIARQALQPEYRVFYDALIDYGDWILIEPFGFVFRPRVAWNQWQPFEDGFWAPTDLYGWVWISAEPFGWATYHYGEWMWDRFQGWVWTPGVTWTPASVSWVVAGDYIGWGPLTARGSADPGTSAMHFAPIAQLGATDLRTRLVAPAQIQSSLRDARPIRNIARVEGTLINRGPEIELVEAHAGPMRRVQIEDLVPRDLGQRIAGSPTRVPALAGPSDVPRDSAAVAREAIEEMNRAGERAAAEARRLTGLSRATPARISILRPILTLPPGATRPRDRSPAPSRAPADTTR